MRHSRTLTTLTAALAAGGLLVAGAAGASADDTRGFGHPDSTSSSLRDGWQRHGHGGGHHGHGRGTPVAGTPVTVAEHLIGPLTFDVTRQGLYVGQDFAGLLTFVAPGQAPTDLAAGPGIAAVSVSERGVTWAEREGDQTQVLASRLMRRANDGTISQVVDLLASEQANNPDGGVSYGFTDLPPECAATLPPEFAPYTGAIDSHGYGSVTVGRTTYVADAGANALLAVDKRGDVRTVAVLPAALATVPAEVAAAFGLDPCVVGHTYAFEPVPTDVEQGPGGKLYVSTLPGGPEDGSLGPLGSVYLVDPRSGAVTLLATGLSGATGLAVREDGTVFVAELYANEVSSISRRGVVSTFVSLNQPAGVEWAKGSVYVSTDVFGDGKVVSVPVS